MLKVEAVTICCRARQTRRKIVKGCLPIAKLKKYKLESSDLGATWAIWLPTYVDSKTQLTPKSDNVNKQKFMRSAWAYYLGVMNYGIE